MFSQNNGLERIGMGYGGLARLAKSDEPINDIR
jgi:hypothetical protein